MIHHQMELYNLLIQELMTCFFQFNKWLEYTVHCAIPENMESSI